MKQFFNIHDLVRVEVNGATREMTEGYKHYLRHFEVAQALKADYRVEPFSKSADAVVFPGQPYALSYTGGTITEYTTYANRATNALIQLLLVSRGASFVHSAGISLNGRGIIFPAHGGVGKTMLMSHLIEKGEVNFFGDDFVIVDRAATMRSFPSDFSIYPYHLNYFPRLRGSRAQRFLRWRPYLAWFYFCRRAINFIWKRLHLSSYPLPLGWNAAYAKVPARELMDEEKIGMSVPLAASVFLERYAGSTIRQEEMTAAQIVERIKRILQAEFKFARPYLEGLSRAGNLDLKKTSEEEERILTEAFSKIKCYKVSLPTSLPNEEYFSAIDAFLKSIV